MAGVVLAVSLLWVATTRARARAKAKKAPAVTDLPPEERYELADALGEGAFGRVVRARSRGGGRDCALKIVEDAEIADREVQVQLGLSHPHIAKMLDSFKHGGRVYIASEACHGGELVDALEEHGRYSEADARIAFRQITSAVAHLHGREIAHRDLKLESVLLEERGVALAQNRLKLIDFGFARAFEPGRASMRTICGSGEFMAPEVVEGLDYDERCDVFSCGAMLHALLCGEMPFGDHTCTGRVPFGGPAFESSLSREARLMVERMLRRLPEERPTSEEVLREAWLLGHIAEEAPQDMCASPPLQFSPSPLSLASRASSTTASFLSSSALSDAVAAAAGTEADA